MADAPHRKTTASHKRVGSVVRGKYRVDAFLATGTMANVYSATHRNGAKVALKILHPQLAEDPSLCERFKREGYFANSIGHPGIVRAIDDDVTEDGCAFLVMELLEGESLDERRRRKGGKLPLGWVLPVAESLLDILAAAHARDVVHRDLKPDNVFVTKTGEVKVLDFGLARFNDGKSSSDMTGVGMVLGTPAYMPPEQALGRREDVDAQSDLWAVGATLFVVLSGEPVHAGGDAKAKLIATARTAARPLREAAPEVPRAVAAVIDRALAFHKSERWADAEAMREALRWARMATDDASGKLPDTQDPSLDPIPPPVPTRRAMDDEPTMARAAPMGALLRELGAREPRPESNDFLTSAPPITLRDAPKAAGAEPASLGPAFSVENEPVFSLRREKEGEPSPSTERLPAPEGNASPAARRDAVAHASTMPAYDPSAADAMGTGDVPASSTDDRGERSIEVNLSFTRPMAAMVMPGDYEPPRPAAGEPPPAFPPPPAQAAYASMPPAFDAPAFDAPAPMATYPPMRSSPPTAGFSQMTTSPSMRVQAGDTSRASLPPGPLLSQIVKPGIGRTGRVLLFLALALVAVGGVVVGLRMRAANARAAAAAAARAATSGETAASASASAAAVAAAPSTSASASASASSSSASAATSAAAVVAASPAPSATETKRPKRPRRTRPAPKASEAAPAETAPAVTSAPENPEPPPPDLTPKDSLPQKDPKPGDSAGF